jgi:hypothetical protein
MKKFDSESSIEAPVGMSTTKKIIIGTGALLGAAGLGFVIGKRRAAKAQQQPQVVVV